MWGLRTLQTRHAFYRWAGLAGWILACGAPFSSARAQGSSPQDVYLTPHQQEWHYEQALAKLDAVPRFSDVSTPLRRLSRNAFEKVFRGELMGRTLEQAGHFQSELARWLGSLVFGNLADSGRLTLSNQVLSGFGVEAFAAEAFKHPLVFYWAARVLLPALEEDPGGALQVRRLVYRLEYGLLSYSALEPGFIDELRRLEPATAEDLERVKTWLRDGAPSEPGASDLALYRRLLTSHILDVFRLYRAHPGDAAGYVAERFKMDGTTSRERFQLWLERNVDPTLMRCARALGFK